MSAENITQDRDASPPDVRITEEALDKLRERLGIEDGLSQYNHAATPDAIRHFALGIGDDNPLFHDEDYARNTRWGGMIAPPHFVMTCGFARSRGLPGIHGLFTGIDLHCHKPILAGTPITARCSLHDLVERQGRYSSGRQFQQIYATRYLDDTGEVLSTAYSHAFRVERKSGKSKGKYRDLARERYTDEQLRRIEQAYDAELVARRGARPRFFEDVQIGDELHPILKGPLTVTDMICFLMGFGYIYVRAHRQWHDFRKQHPRAGLQDKYGVWDIPERVHWEEDLAQEIGMPTAYDYGPQRIAWFGHALTDWAGDDGWVRRVKVSLVEPNFVGDCTWIKGRITGRNEADASIQLEMEAVDQRDRKTAVGSAELVLPRR